MLSNRAEVSRNSWLRCLGIAGWGVCLIIAAAVVFGVAIVHHWAAIQDGDRVLRFVE